MQNPKDITERTFQYALRSIKLYQFLRKQKEWTGWVIGEQFLKSATSIGANMEEAQAGESFKDFIHKCGIAQKETRESLYWLKLLAEANIIPKSKLEPLMQETEELYAIITKIILNSKRRSK